MFPLAEYRASMDPGGCHLTHRGTRYQLRNRWAIQKTTEDIERTNRCNVQNKLLNLELVCQTLSDEILSLWLAA